jgi:choline dehydrogenase-like flavoprotein
MLYVRGNKKDYDIWESLGNTGWGSEEAVYYFKKSEDNRNPYLARTPYHSTGGYLTVQEAPWHTPLAAAFVQAGVEMGYVCSIIFLLYHSTKQALRNTDAVLQRVMKAFPDGKAAKR